MHTCTVQAREYLEKPIVSFTPIIPWVWQRSVDRDLVADVLVESIVLQLWFSKEKKGVFMAVTVEKDDLW